jgi:inhibitor of cysteine peptidase
MVCSTVFAQGSIYISGVVTNASDTPVSGIAVALLQKDVVLTTTTTKADGSYIFGSLADGSYTVKPGKLGFTFSPVSQVIEVSPSDDTVDFTATEVVQNIYSIGGTVLNAKSVALTGIGVVLTQGTVTKAVTHVGDLGKYIFSGLPAGTYTVTPDQADFSFAPLSQTVTIGPSKSGVDFVGAVLTPKVFGIVGSIKNNAGAILTGVGLGLYKGETLIATTHDGPLGNYAFTGLAAGTYTVKPAAFGYKFSPVFLTETVGPTKTEANFVGTH